jgi:hypothetical protein
MPGVESGGVEPAAAAAGMVLAVQDSTEDRFHLAADFYRADSGDRVLCAARSAARRPTPLPRAAALYDLATVSLEDPRIAELISDGAPCYAWSPDDRSDWSASSTRLLPRIVAFATRA